VGEAVSYTYHLSLNLFPHYHYLAKFNCSTLELHSNLFKSKWCTII